ncbi:MAG: PIN domain-containing protein [Spirochaetaceae bacterium]|nr:PIN domain-containing protein [Spirochaetaceae bacterium]
MILADTNIWIDHLRAGDSRLVHLLEEDELFMHPAIRGELSLGSIRDRTGFITMLAYLPSLKPSPDEEVMALIEETQLFGRGIGWVDAQLLTACLSRPCRFWTRDRRLAAVATELGIGA